MGAGGGRGGSTFQGCFLQGQEKCQNLLPVKHVNFPPLPHFFFCILQLPSVKWLRVGKLCHLLGIIALAQNPDIY